MTLLRRRVRAVALAWLLCQVASLSAFVPDNAAFRTRPKRPRRRKLPRVMKRRAGAERRRCVPASRRPHCARLLRDHQRVRRARVAAPELVCLRQHGRRAGHLVDDSRLHILVRAARTAGACAAVPPRRSSAQKLALSFRRSARGPCRSDHDSCQHFWRSNVFSCQLFIALALALTIARPVSAQQTVDVGSISGRVVDDSGVAVPGASVTATHRPPTSWLRPSSRRTADSGFPTCASASTRSRRRSPVSRISTRRLTVSAGSAFEMPVALAVAGIESNVTVDRRGAGDRGGPQPDRRDGVGGRSRGAADERAQLPRAGVAGARRCADQHRQHAAVSRDVGGSRHHALGRQPAQPLEQLRRRRAVGQRRCGGLERDHLRRGCDRAVPGR